MYKAFEEAYEQGIVRAIGVSNFSQDFYDSFIKTSHVTPAINQVESHVYYPQLIAHMENYGTHMQSWGSFTEGRKDIFHEPLLMDIAEKYILQTSFLKRKSREIRFPSHLLCIFAI